MIAERLTTVEARLAHLESRLGELHKDVRETRDTIVKQRGYIAGFASAFSILGVAIAGLAGQLWKQVIGQ